MPPWRIRWAPPGTLWLWCTSGRVRGISARASTTATACRPASVREGDALVVLQEQCGGWHNWSLPGLLNHLEAYNGFGYRQYQINSPYLWSFATCHTRGKFVVNGAVSIPLR